ncbi:zinc finger protein 69 homolog B-like [Plodia interpunctella]|uniref:zinc finger protein 69 homolog B-like n=1 Tax=Plodia interpunctella TaxID=58824 RepID=UPI0023683CD6|nr:zinc finger protein 69 homolog B-like [Plodia interpunctella]
MASKLIINKFENGANFKSLQVTIEDGKTKASEAKFSEWTEGKSQHKIKDIEKSSRLVVKIISEDEMNELDLDSCAKEVRVNQVLETQKFFTNVYEDHIEYKPMITNQHYAHKFQRSNNILNQFDERGQDKAPSRSLLFQEDTEMEDHGSSMRQFERAEGDKSPLEYSLERVKENNARIMENIQILNRTLNYTKKKETLDIVCPKSMRSHPCDTCGKCFVYETGLKRHYATRHAITEMPPRWQIVWTCIECFQVWPRQESALKHASECCKSDSVDSVREIKTSSLLQCEFCEKVFTSIPRLLRHCKTHTTENNYECNACEATFLSYKSAEQHWLLCPWLRICYSFSLPKLLLCNACDRKFRNYEHLYNHRYKIGHFTTKTHGNFNVYQCEMCGQSFSTIPSLQVHKLQCHPRFDPGVLCNNVKSYGEYPNTYYLESEQDNNKNYDKY